MSFLLLGLFILIELGSTVSGSAARLFLICLTGNRECREESARHRHERTSPRNGRKIHCSAQESQPLSPPHPRSTRRVIDSEGWARKRPNNTSGRFCSSTTMQNKPWGLFRSLLALAPVIVLVPLISYRLHYCKPRSIPLCTSNSAPQHCQHP
jgi:hypothetical protein